MRCLKKYRFWENPEFYGKKAYWDPVYNGYRASLDQGVTGCFTFEARDTATNRFTSKRVCIEPPALRYFESRGRIYIQGAGSNSEGRVSGYSGWVKFSRNRDWSSYSNGYYADIPSGYSGCFTFEARDTETGRRTSRRFCF